MLETDVLIIGSGPAGSSAALMLSTYGISNMVVTKHRWLADSPRAHYQNQRTMEIFRDMDIHDEIISKASPKEIMGNVVFCSNLAGEEFGRIPLGANSPKRHSDYAIASPCCQCDLPQHLLEPILLSNAASRGTHVRFDTEYLSFIEENDNVIVTVKDRLTGFTYPIKTKYLLGADGGNSRLAEDLGLSMEGRMGLAGSISIVLHADLSKYVAHRPAYLWWLMQPGANEGGIGMGLLRMVRPWNEWQIVWGYDINKPTPNITEDEATNIAYKLIGDDKVAIKIRSISTWTVNQMYATKYSKGRIFCLGDAVHRHPPSNGLGSNTSIQDSYNLAWKIAYVLKGHANSILLESYNDERVPVGKQVVERANKSIKEFKPLFDALGVDISYDTNSLKENINSLYSPTLEGKKRRTKLRQAIAYKSYEFAAQGVELNIRYTSAAISIDRNSSFNYEKDAELYYKPSTEPGGRLPHVWLDQCGTQISSLDLVGHGRFTLLVGIEGEPWVTAAKDIENTIGFHIEVIKIGLGQKIQDLYGDWEEINEINENGCLLVRPDGHIAWRSKNLEHANIRLLTSVKRILGLID